MSVSIDALKQELSALSTDEQRKMTAFLVSLQDSRNAVYGQKLAGKIEKPASQFATLEDLDRRLKSLGDNSGQ